MRRFVRARHRTRVEARIGSGELEAALADRHRTIIATGSRVLVIVEGADGAGKTTSIERATRHLDPAHGRIVKLGPPTERERGEWYFQRWLAHLPTAGELVVFDRSWYNRAAFEPVHGLCTAAERDAFLLSVPELERLLVADGLHLAKLFLSVSRDVQARRLAERPDDQRSPFDRAATATWSEMRAAHEHMLATTPPWIVVDTDDDRRGTLAALEAFVTALEVPDVRRSRHADADEHRSATR